MKGKALTVVVIVGLVFVVLIVVATQRLGRRAVPPGQGPPRARTGGAAPSLLAGFDPKAADEVPDGARVRWEGRVEEVEPDPVGEPAPAGKPLTVKVRIGADEESRTTYRAVFELNESPGEALAGGALVTFEGTVRPGRGVMQFYDYLPDGRSVASSYVTFHLADAEVLRLTPPVAEAEESP